MSGIKKYVGIVGCFLILQVPLSALPIGNPSEASLLQEGLCLKGYADCDPSAYLCWCDCWSLRLGFYGDYVFDRYMEVNQRHNESHIRQFQLFTNASYLALNFFDTVDLFATLGASKFSISTPATAFYLDGDNTNLISNIDSEWYFSWSLGARMTLWECRGFALGAEAQYFRSRPNINYFQLEGYAPLYLENSRTNYREYQLGLGGAYTIYLAGCSTFVVPYFGIKWAHADVNMGDFSIPTEIGISSSPVVYELYNLESENKFGVALGTTLVGCKRWSITAEGRFSDELALFINSQIRF